MDKKQAEQATPSRTAQNVNGRIELHRFRYCAAAEDGDSPPPIQVIQMVATQGDLVRYRLLSISHYLEWRLANRVDRIRA